MAELPNKNMEHVYHDFINAKKSLVNWNNVKIFNNKSIVKKLFVALFSIILNSRPALMPNSDGEVLLLYKHV